ncbi:MAG: DUF362 domain-containing protein [Faecalibacterium sp.]|jgi:uncharacterized protein (DUF362 family)/ferredoxin|nr:DUF362 domain-containing protein [Faecalibacterium sp.]
METAKSAVILSPAISYAQTVCDNAVEAIFAALPAAQKIGPETKILLKPNLLAKHPPEAAVTTHPAVVAAVIRACLARGAKAEHITVADSAGGVYNPGQMKALYKVSGLADACAPFGVACYTACETGPRKTAGGKVVSEFELIRPVLEADFIIDLPKFKTHVMTGMTAACKNLFGTIPGLKKAEWHMRFPEKERFGEMLIDLLETVRPDMAIVDAVVGLEGDGPAGGEAHPVGLLLGSENLPNLDLACAALMGLDPMRVPYLAAAQARGLCAAAFDPADLRGEPALFVPVKGWKLPASYTGGAGANTDFAHSDRVPKLFRPAVAWGEKRLAPHPVVNRALCIGCGKCAEICPQQTITIKNGKSHIGPKKCIRCFCCHEMCPVKAIDVKQLRLFRL